MIEGFDQRNIKSQIKNHSNYDRNILLTNDEIFGEDSDYDTAQILAKEYIAKTGFRKLPQVLLNGVPLQEKSLVEEDFEEAVLVELVTQTQTLQKAVYKRELTDTDNVVDWLMTQPNVMPR